MTCATCADTIAGEIMMTLGDTNPPLVGHLENGDGTRPDLTGATVKIRIRDASGSNITFGTAGLTITNLLLATFSYGWAVGDTDAVGSLRVTFVVTFPSGRVETFPSGGRFILVRVGA